MMLENIGYEVLEAKNGQEGIEKYQKNMAKIDLVLLDMLMPVMSGTQCFYQLKKINPEVKVVLSSGFTRDEDLTGLKKAGLSDVLRKPYNVLEMSRAVGNALKTSIS